MVNLYAEATIVSKKNQIKTIECYEPIHEHNSYFNPMGHVAPQAPPGPPPRTPSPSLHSPVDDQVSIRWTHQRVPNPQPSHKDRHMWQGTGILAPVMATQRHSTLQTTQFHAAIFFNEIVTFVQNLKNI